ncbi:MAG: MFS transporter [Caldilineaceae bacterium]|nr:MFS transporter [Caldilineaceae bacterium]
MSRRNFTAVFIADFLVRSAYQMGKTPLLPIFAASLGATDVLLGSIVAVSTLTGMLSKPLFGIFSDRWGRRLWLFVGTAFFAIVPFLYRFVHTPEQLVLIRIIHGTATAIYGPVTVAFVAEQAQQHRGEKLGWFSMARSGGYILGPLLAGWLLLFVEPQAVFTLIGLLSLLAFVPVFLLSDAGQARLAQRMSLTGQTVAALSAGIHTPAIWLSGILEATVYIALYAAKAFLPIYALSIGINVAVVGAFLPCKKP